jgi:phosphoribosylanthranilate isomerase
MSFPPAAATPWIKVCGLTRLPDVLLAHELGAAFFGLILTTRSPRHLPLDRAAALVKAARRHAPGLRFIGVFVDEPAGALQEALDLLELAAVQIHGPLPAGLDPGRVVPALGVSGDRPPADRAAALSPLHPAVLLDTAVKGQSGGTGQLFDHALAVPVITARPTLLAGGLTPDNIAGVVDRLRALAAMPYGFDLSSGVEASPGIKDPARLRAFFAAWREAVAP